MSFAQSALLVVLFFVLFRFVIPRLFPSVVQGTYVVDPAKLRRQSTKKRNDDDVERSGGDGNSSGVSAVDDSPFVISGGGLGFVTGHRTQAKAQLRRRNAESKSAMV